MSLAHSVKISFVIQDFLLDFHVTGRDSTSKFLKHLGWRELPITRGLSLSPRTLQHNITVNLIFRHLSTLAFLQCWIQVPATKHYSQATAIGLGHYPCIQGQILKTYDKTLAYSDWHLWILNWTQ
jgi:hypothetical protein